ncbi:MAG: Rieske 2Fe-2S domain-containing protein [Micrococcales bacterium]|nr:Rieske 2Fe-2S domain-containing protein [Micrococcales bacterium]
MSAMHPRHVTAFPRNAWYAVAASREVGRAPLARRALGTPVVLYRTSTGDVAVLEDRCVHRPVPLSLGKVEGDQIVSGYSGFVYGPDGVVVSVPTQEHVPVGARVKAFPARESAGQVWVWLGEPARAGLQRVPAAPWLEDPAWATFGDQWETKAAASLLQDNFSDITHVANVDPLITPPALQQSPPPLDVQVTETQVTFSRDYAPAPVPAWQAEMMGVPTDSTHPQREEGRFVSPGLWVDRWDATVSGHGEADGVKTLVFTHAITPVDDTTTRHAWRVSRNFADSERATGTLEPIFRGYYTRVQEILETMQQVVDRDGPHHGVNVQADAAMLQVRKIMRRLAAEESSA